MRLTQAQVRFWYFMSWVYIKFDSCSTILTLMDGMEYNKCLYRDRYTCNVNEKREREEEGEASPPSHTLCTFLLVSVLVLMIKTEFVFNVQILSPRLGISFQSRCQMVKCPLHDSILIPRPSSHFC